MSEGLQHIGAALGSFGVHVVMVNGACDTHGAAEVLVRKGALWHCPDCLEAKMATEARELWIAARSADLMATATVPTKYVGQKFDATCDDHRAVRCTVQLYRDLILKGQVWAALVLVGKTGTCKTLLTCELAQSLIHRASRSVRYITAAGMISEIQACYGREGRSEEGEIMRFAQYDVLILDEIDAIRNTDNANLLLTENVNRRYNENKPVIVISTQPFGNLAKFVGKRVHSRLHENVFVCDFKWDDVRRGDATIVETAPPAKRPALARFDG